MQSTRERNRSRDITAIIYGVCIGTVFALCLWSLGMGALVGLAVWMAYGSGWRQADRMDRS